MINYEMALSEIEMYKKAHESLSENLNLANEKSQQYKEERDMLIDDITLLRSNNKRLKYENEGLRDYNATLIANNKGLEDERNYYNQRYTHIKTICSELEQENDELGDYRVKYVIAQAHIKQLQTQQGSRESSREYTKLLEKENVLKHNLLSEISQHIGNKPSSSKYKYFRAKLDGVGIKEGE